MLHGKRHDPKLLENINTFDAVLLVLSVTASAPVVLAAIVLVAGVVAAEATVVLTAVVAETVAVGLSPQAVSTKPITSVRTKNAL
jgi:hypothetical protein